MLKCRKIIIFVIGVLYIASEVSYGIPRFRRSKVSACSQPPNSGMCLALFIQYYYNETSDTCHNFVYGGCGGNDNNFDTGEECVNTCGGTIVESDRNFAPIFGEAYDYDFDLCDLPPDIGPCEDNDASYYFDGEKCEAVGNGNCPGSLNKFRTKEECLETCGYKISVDEKEN